MKQILSLLAIKILFIFSHSLSFKHTHFLLTQYLKGINMSNKNRFFTNNQSQTPFGLLFKEQMSRPSLNKNDTVSGGASPTHTPRGSDTGGCDFDVDFG